MSNLRRHPRKSSSRSSPIPFRSLEKGLVLAGIGVVLMLAQVFTGGAVLASSASATSSTSSASATSSTGNTEISSGYWLASSYGAVYSYGSALDLGSLVDIHLSKPIVSIASTPDGKGYWLVASDGGVFAFGDAQFYGSTGAIDLSKPIVSMASTPDGKGYWLVASDGGVFAFGDAQFYGSSAQSNLGIACGIATTLDAQGYWISLQNSSVASFGDAPPKLALTYENATTWTSAVGPIAVTPDGQGYLVSDSRGDVRSFGDALDPSPPPNLSTGPIVALAQSVTVTSTTSTQSPGGSPTTTSPGGSPGSGSPTTTSPGGSAGSGAAGSSSAPPRKGLPSTAPLTSHNPYRHGVVPSLAWIASQNVAHVHSGGSVSESGGSVSESGGSVSESGGSHAKSPRLTDSPNNLYFSGGTSSEGVVTGSPKVYLIYYGSQWGTESTNIQGNPIFSGDPNSMAPYLEAFFEGLGTNSEGWSQVMTQYCQGVLTGTQFCPSSAQSISYPTSNVLAGVWEDTSQPSPLSATESQLAQEAINGAIHFGNTSPSSNLSAQYLVISPTGTSPDGFVSAGFCAWHSNTYASFGAIAYTNLPYIPDAGTSCGENFVNSGSAGLLDGVSIVEGHEYAETLTDPIPETGWSDSYGYETGDKCVWIPPGMGQGAAQDISLATGSFAVQSTWANNFDGGVGGCEISATTSTLPSVDSLSISSGTSLGGTSLDINGVNFSGATQVDFGSTPAISFTVDSDTMISAVSPAGSGTVDITVTTSAGTSATSSADQFTYVTTPPPPPPPSVTSVSPTSGPSSGGTQVTIAGSGFTGANAVNFGSSPAAGFSIISDQEIVGVSPSGSGTVDITVTTSAGTSATSSADQFTYVTTPPPPPGQPPKIISASPKTGPKSGGTQVFIYGSNFTGATKVDFGTQSATFTILSDSEILATSPAGTGQVSLSVKNSAGTSPTVAQAHFTYNSSKVPMLNRNSAANSYSYLLAILHRLTEFEIPVLEHFL